VAVRSPTSHARSAPRRRCPHALVARLALLALAAVASAACNGGPELPAAPTHAVERGRIYGIGGAPIASQDGATCRLDAGGALHVSSSVTEQGQGTNAILAAKRA